MEILQLPIRPYPSQNVTPLFEGSPHVYPRLQPNLGVTLKDADSAKLPTVAVSPSIKSPPNAAAIFSQPSLPTASPLPSDKVTSVSPTMASQPSPTSIPTLSKAAEDQVLVHNGQSEGDEEGEQDSKVDENDSHKDENDSPSHQTDGVEHSTQPSVSMENSPSGKGPNPVMPYSQPPSPDNRGTYFNITH